MKKSEKQHFSHVGLLSVSRVMAALQRGHNLLRTDMYEYKKVKQKVALQARE